MNKNIYNLKNEIKSYFDSFSIPLKFHSRNLSEVEIYICFEFQNKFDPFDIEEDLKKFKDLTKELYFNNEYFNYCLSETNKIEFFNFDYYDF